ncbi:MAG: DEAD/DEAH box helicase (plasmid) [Candidatus Methanoperedens sp.]|nr:MAG: DEAD/DEAH box helicase [Candidatus Methanoperedens sp.]
MAIQTTLDTFTTIKQYYNSTVNTIIISTQVPVLEEPVILSIEPIAVTPVENLASADYTLPDISCYEDYSCLQSSTIYCMDQPESDKLPDIEFKIEGNTNELLWKYVADSHPGAFDRSYILDTYKTLGQTVKIEGDRGLADMARRREANYAQFFTLKEIVQFVTRALGLDQTDKKAVVVDNSCGIGGMFRYLSPSCLKTGIELEEQAYHMAARLWPDAYIIQDSLINHPTIQGDYFLINPPFSMQLEQKNIPLENASWGDLGPNSSIQSHIAALEIAIKNASKYVVAVLPMGYFTNENTYTFEKWVNEHAELVLRVDMPAEVWKDAGTAWPCSIVIYRTKFHHYNRKSAFVRTITKLSDLDAVLEEWKRTQHYNEALEDLNLIDNAFQQHTRPQTSKAQQITVTEPDLPLPDSGHVGVKVALAPDSSNLVIRSSNLLEALKVRQYLDGMGQQWNDGLKAYTQESDVRFRRKHILNNSGFIPNIISDLCAANLKASLDPQVTTWIMKKKRWLERQLTPFEQYIRKDDEWICLNEHNGIRSMYPELYEAREKQLRTLGIDWLWDFQKDDVIRMSLKNTNLLCWSMGLGKTRGIVALALLYGTKHNLIIVEPKLTDEFIKEFRELGITDYQIIESERDLKHPKKFNLIAYNKLWKPLNEHTRKTFAKAMRRRFQFIAVDEAHKIKAKDSEQAKAVRILKARYKLLSTGTPITNYPRNIFSLLVFGWGDGTELNHYGYHNPIEKTNDRGYTSGYTTGTRQFKEDFISIEWVTPQFEQTLDKGMKAREMPKIKDTAKWWAMMSPKIIRRQREEPEVAAFVTIPKPDISTELIKMSPEQVKHYKHWLDEFAAWFKEQLRLEKQSEGHKIDQMVVLAHLTQLQFASTIPQSKKTNNEHIQWPGGITTKQRRTLDLIKEALSKEEKVIVFSERPDFQKLMQQELKTRGIKSHVFIGSQGIKNRNVVLTDFKNNGTHVLLATTTCGETGLNIPQANVVIIADTSWTPSKQIQAYSRILRPQQTRKPRIYLLRAKGTIDEYMQQLMDAKSEAIDEGIDYQDATEFDPAKWLSYRDFTLKMLKEEGYDMD